MSDPVRPTFQFEQRAFIPWAKVPGPYAGDNRGYSLSGETTSRIAVKVNLDPASIAYNGLVTKSDPTTGPRNVIGPITTATATSKSEISADNKLYSTLYDIQTHGANPLIPMAPDIDLRTQIQLSILPGYVFITAKFNGDAFPASEYVIRDHSGQGIFLGGFMPASNTDLQMLVGNAARPLGTLSMMVTVDKDGNFGRITAAHFQGPNGEVGREVKDLLSTFSPSMAGPTSNSFSLDGWNRAATNILTPDGMPPAERIRPENQVDHKLEKGIDRPAKAPGGREL